MIGLFLFAAIYGLILYSLKNRLLPVIFMRFWFTLFLFFSVLSCFLACHVIEFLAQTLKWIDSNTAAEWCRGAKTIVFRYLFFPNVPHIHLKPMPGTLPFSVLSEKYMMCMCHTSFFDSLFFLCITPLQCMMKSKTFIKSSLRNLPLFGYVLRCCGHFPVYFADENSQSFSVQKEKQVQVAEDVEDFISHGGNLCIFPEGALNHTPEVLKDFRLGSFNTIINHKRPLRYIAIYGNNEIWNARLKGIPGFPTDLYYYIGEYKYDPEHTDARTLATGLREEMQKHIDDILEERRKSGYVPYYNPKVKAT